MLGHGLTGDGERLGQLGGPGFAIYDTMRLLDCEVATVALADTVLESRSQFPDA